MAVCRDPGCDSHYGCRLRAKGVQVSASAMPSRHNRKATPTEAPSWEKGVAGERRPDGSFMPYVGADRQPIGVYEQAHRRHELTEQVSRLKADPTIFEKERTTP